MKTLISIKKDIEFNGGLSSLLEVLKNISVSQFKALEGRAKINEKFQDAINGFFGFLGSLPLNHPFLTPASNLQLVVAVTSDSGLLGGLNNEVVNTALGELNQIPGKLVVVGERGKVYMRESKTAFTAFSGIREETQHEQVTQLRNYLVSRFIEESLGYLKVVFPRPISFTVQKVEVVTFLPFSMEKNIAVKKISSLSDVILESTPADIMEYLLYLWMGHKLAEIFVLSRLAEFAARFVHLEGCSQRLKEMDKKLKLQYFRVRHELIDRSMRELFSARALYAG